MAAVHTARPISERSLETLLQQAMQARVVGRIVLRDVDGLRHGVWVEAGYVVGVHVAGRFDPLLELMWQSGLLNARSHRTCVAALYDAELRCGELATRLAGVPSSVVREALRRQVSARFIVLLELSESAGYDAQLEACPIPNAERSLRMPLGSLQRHGEQTRGSGETARLPASTGDHQARRALRTLARALHPDLHPHLDIEARARLSERLARATAAYHGFSPRPPAL
ncbi:MAG: hypothetical protein JWN04_3956 [Myxococcaceae bacterium]|nr:hypothetical protein [Myxococcaceae bacterium]